MHPDVPRVADAMTFFSGRHEPRDVPAHATLAKIVRTVEMQPRFGANAVRTQLLADLALIRPACSLQQ